MNIFQRKLPVFAFAATVLASAAPTAGGQTTLTPQTQNWSKPVLFDSFWQADRTEPDFVRPSATPRLRLFGMPSGFLAAPIGLEDEEDAVLANEAAITGAARRDDDFKNVQVSLGMDNPFFDLRRPGSIGGVGYYQVYSQVQLLETGTTSMCMNLQAYAPAGVQWGGLNNGPTFLCPAFSMFHDLGGGTAIHGFVSENLNAGAGWQDNWERKMYYGMAWQCPLGSPNDGVYFFVQTLGHLGYDPARDSTRPAMMVLPGIQWRMADNCWLSLGGSGHGLITCSWQF